MCDYFFFSDLQVSKSVYADKPLSKACMTTSYDGISVKLIRNAVPDNSMGTQSIFPAI